MRWKKGGALQNEEIIVINQGGARKKYSDKKTGETPQKVMSPGVPGGDGVRTIWPAHNNKRIERVGKVDIDFP